MTPIYKVLSNGNDISNILLSNDAKLSYSDSSDDEADEVSITTTGSWLRPKYEDILDVWIGYEETGLYHMGKFSVQSTSKTRFDLTTKATGADFSIAIKEKRNKSYDKLSLADIAKEVAGRHGLECKTDMDDIKIKHLAQSNESDLNMLTNLASEYNAIFQIKNKTLLFLKRDNDELPLFTIVESECSSWNIEHSNKRAYKSCKATWHDTKANKPKEVVVGSGSPQLLLNGQFKDIADAKAKAEAKLSKSTRGTVSGNISIYGQNIRAGGRLLLIGFGEDDGLYSISTVDHDISEGGYSISVSFESAGKEPPK